ncbi:MAG: endolytic transglycosylase MltG [Clostridia bacterium]|nr:endolytic transglycosylase MltG [Clostridia bacterium]
MKRDDKTELSAVRLRWRRFWHYARPIATWLLSIGLVAVIVIVAVQFVLSHYISAVDPDDATPYEVVIPQNASAGKIADLLYHACGEGEKGLIVSSASFKIYVDFVGKANSLKAGTYRLSKNMTIPEIVDVLTEGNPMRQTTRLVVTEGKTVEEIAAILRDSKEITTDPEAFLALCRDSATFSKYPFIAELPNAGERRYVLEGYLFPDTYDVYVDSAPEEILDKMLTRYYEIYSGEWVDRAQELGLSRDQVMTLASIIEREAGDKDDFTKVSAVFHNRLQKGMKLESCATLNYITGQDRYTFSADEMAIVSPYNTYLNEGLPIGPIGNPGATAIYAALYPDEEFLAEDYLYFCNANPKETRKLVFSKTYEEHKANVEKYKEFWN